MIRYQGIDYDFDIKRTSANDLREIKRQSGLTVARLLQGIDDLDIDAIAALRWLVLRSDGQHDDLPFDPKAPFDDYWEFLQGIDTELGEALAEVALA